MAIEIYRDEVSSKIDELADIIDVWRKWRSKGVTSNATRNAIIMIAGELQLELNLEKMKYTIPAEITPKTPAPPQACT